MQADEKKTTRAIEYFILSVRWVTTHQKSAISAKSEKSIIRVVIHIFSDSPIILIV